MSNALRKILLTASPQLISASFPRPGGRHNRDRSQHSEIRHDQPRPAAAHGQQSRGD
jgi:hypothetical protein